MFTKTFASLLNHNVYITDCMEVLSKITNNEVYKMLIFDTITNLAKGEAISNSFKNHWAFPDIAYEMILTGVYTSIAPDLSYFLGENNLSNYKNDEIISAINEINNITDQEQLKERYAKIFGICNEEVPYIGLYYNNDMVAYSTDLMGTVRPNCYSIFYNFSNWYRQ